MKPYQVGGDSVEPLVGDVDKVFKGNFGPFESVTYMGPIAESVALATYVEGHVENTNINMPEWYWHFMYEAVMGRCCNVALVSRRKTI